MTKEGAQQHASTLDRPAGVARPVEQALQVQRGPIRQRMAFEIPPEAFDGIQFWRVGWEEDRMDLGGEGQEGLDLSGPMRSEAIPQEDHGRPELAAQLAKEARHLRSRDAAVRMETEIQTDAVPRWRHTESGEEGDLLMAPGPLEQHGSLSLPTPGPSDQRGHQHATLIHNGEPGLQARGVFFTRGQVCLIHPRMAWASRSTAWRCGFWTLQPSARKSRLT